MLVACLLKCLFKFLNFLVHVADVLLLCLVVLRHRHVSSLLLGGFFIFSQVSLLSRHHVLPFALDHAEDADGKGIVLELGA